MSTGTVLMVVLMAFVVIVVIKAIVIVPRGHVFVIAYLGRPVGVLPAGLQIVPAFVTTVLAKVPVEEQVLDVPDTSGHLRDGTAVAAKGSLRYRVTDPLVAVTHVADYRQALAQLTQAHWRRAIETRDVASFDPTLETALAAIRKDAASWGIEAIDTTVVATLSEDGMQELQKQATLERELRVIEWLATRHESPGPDGLATEAQHAAYDAWMARQVAGHRAEIDAAARDADSRHT